MEDLFEVCPSVSDAQAKIDAFNTDLTFPTPDGRTVTYSTPIPHPADARALVQIKPYVQQYMSADRIAGLQTLDQVKAMGWFPARAM